MILEKITGYKALAIQGNLNKVHLYDNSLDAVKEQLSRDVLKFDKCKLGLLWDNNPKHINESNELFNMYNNKGLDYILNILDCNNFKLESYESYPAINVKMLERNE